MERVGARKGDVEEGRESALRDTSAFPSQPMLARVRLFRDADMSCTSFRGISRDLRSVPGLGRIVCCPLVAANDVGAYPNMPAGTTVARLGRRPRS
ncbi:hypothetical protein MRX96_029177 [Rhipicephalus microplus]